MESGLSPKVAVITVYFNRPDNIEDSVQSLISQTYKNLDIFIIDDCSKDNTYQKLKEVEGKDRRIKLYQNERNKGFTKTLIDTISTLDAKYIAIHGAGDISMPTRIEEQVRYLEDNPEVGVLSTDIVNITKRRFKKKEITLKDLLKGNLVRHSAVMFKLEDYIKVGGYRSFFTTRQDRDLWLRMSLITKIHYLPRKLCELIDIEGSVSQTSSKTAIPIHLSGFAVFLIKERVIYNTDSLDLFGEKGALFYCPKRSNKLIFNYLVRNLYNRNFKPSIENIDALLKINTNFFMIFFLRTMKSFLNLLLVTSKRFNLKT
ncbi:MAG: glycosyltransferase family 2 protein [Anditalea sp.]